MPTLRKMRQEDPNRTQDQPGLHSKSQTVEGYTVRPCLQGKKGLSYVMLPPAKSTESKEGGVGGYNTQSSV